jgi:hypothetical protein
MARLPFYLLVLSTLLLVVTADSFLARPPSSSFLPALNNRRASTPASLPSCSIDFLLQTRGGTAATATTATTLPTSALVEKKGGAAAVALEGGKTLWEKSKVWVFIGLWYFFNVAFNIYNKKVSRS